MRDAAADRWLAEHDPDYEACEDEADEFDDNAYDVAPGTHGARLAEALLQEGSMSNQEAGNNARSTPGASLARRVPGSR